MVFFLNLDSATWPAFGAAVQILTKPFPNPLILRPNMINCGERRQAVCYQFQHALTRPAPPSARVLRRQTAVQAIYAL